MLSLLARFLVLTAESELLLQRIVVEGVEVVQHVERAPAIEPQEAVLEGRLGCLHKSNLNCEGRGPGLERIV